MADQRRSDFCVAFTPWRGAHDIFARGCATLWSLYRPFLEFLRKSMTIFGNFVPNGDFQNTRAVLGKNGFHFQKMLLKLWIFSPNEVKVINQLSLLLVCHLCHQNNWPYLEFLTDIIALSGIFVKNWHTLFGVFSWKYGTNSWHTPCTPHIEVPLPPPGFYH